MDVLVAQLLGTLGANNSGDSTQDHFANYDFQGQDADALLVILKDEPIFSMTIPGKLQAYLVTGKPILAMLNGEGASLVNDSGCGIACDAGDWQCLAESAQKLSRMSYQERDLMGRKGLLLSETEFDREKLISKMKKCISSNNLKILTLQAIFQNRY